MTTDHLGDARTAAGPSPDGSQGWGFGVSVQVRRTDLGPSVGGYGWAGGLGSSWANDPHERVVGVVLTTDMFAGASPRPPRSVTSGRAPTERSMTEAREPRVVLSDLAFVESPRWHDGRFWFAQWGTTEIVAVDLDGNSEVVAHGPPGLGWSIDWLPDGRLLVTGPELLRQEPDGSMVPHADMHTVAEHGWNEIVVDGRGNIYLNGFGFDFLGGEKPEPGIIALVTPDGSARQVADGIEFPNGMVVTPDNSTLIIAESFARRLTAFDIAADGSLSNRRVWADDVGPDAICIDADGAVWTGAADTRALTGRDEDSPGLAFGSPTAARSSSGSSSTGRASGACSAVRTAAPCSCSPSSGGAPTRSTSCSPTAPGRCSRSTRPPPAPAGRDER